MFFFVREFITPYGCFYLPLALAPHMFHTFTLDREDNSLPYLRSNVKGNMVAGGAR
jgi:hypothetical protein